MPRGTVELLLDVAMGRRDELDLRVSCTQIACKADAIRDACTMRIFSILSNEVGAVSPDTVVARRNESHLLILLSKGREDRHARGATARIRAGDLSRGMILAELELDHDGLAIIIKRRLRKHVTVRSEACFIRLNNGASPRLASFRGVRVDLHLRELILHGRREVLNRSACSAFLLLNVLTADRLGEVNSAK